MFLRPIAQTSILLLAFSLFFFACKKSDTKDVRPTIVNDQMANLVYAYTSGLINSNSEIRVQFTQAVSAQADAADAGLLSFSPSIEGVLSWENEHTLLFKPTDRLRPGTAYTATLQTAKLFENLPAEAKAFTFHFNTMEPQFSVDVVGLQAAGSDASKQKLIGTVYTSEPFSEERVQQVLNVKQGSTALPVEWSHEANTTEYSFEVKGIERSDKADEVVVAWEGKSLFSKSAGSTAVPIAADQNFKVLGARVREEGGKHILVQFSDPLQSGQDLRGLVDIEHDGEASPVLRYDIDGQLLRVYVNDRMLGAKNVVIKKGILNTNKKTLASPTVWAVAFARAEPSLRLSGKGVILPNSEGLYFPFEAMGLDYVEVEIHKIFNNNILQFLQTNQIDGDYQMERVSRKIWRGRLALSSLNPNAHKGLWTQYALDLGKIIKADKKAIYQVVIGFLPGYASDPCTEFADIDLSLKTTLEDEDAPSLKNMYYGPNGYYRDYYNDRNNPCKPAFFQSRKFIERNVFASNIGLIAKGNSENSMTVTAADIRSAAPLSGVDIKFYDYQQQVLAEATTDGNGQATAEMEREPFFVVASKSDDHGYLRLQNNNALRLSRFDIGGVSPQKGMKGYLYADRGVWRPGDSVLLNFVLETEGGSIPDNYPVSMDVIDPRGNIVQTIYQNEHIGPIYPLHFSTQSGAPTGSWQARVKVGGAEFSKRISIETVKPNRLKVRMDLPDQEIASSAKNLNTDLRVNWLHGAPASNLKARVQVQAGNAGTSFSDFSEYSFTDPARSVNTNERTVFDNTLDEKGMATINYALSGLSKNAPGKMRLNLNARAFEKGGDFSTGQQSLIYSPYSSYVGLHIPTNQYGSKRIEMNKETIFDVAAVSENGIALANRRLSVGLYRIEWRWWWERGEDQVSRYSSASHTNSLDTKMLTTDAKGEAKLDINVDNWGRYLVRVCDTESGHCTGDYFYAGYPWYGENNENSGATMLSFVADKKSYEVGDNISLTIPAAEAGKCLVSLETGSQVLRSEWFNAKKGENTFTFDATADMAPTIYAHVSLIQPHAQTENDMPIRMYGVIPLEVIDPATRLSPELKIADKLEPNETFSVNVSEADGKPMAYSVAIVDEGLLDLTNHETPNPWDGFYAREALGIRTWDIYDQVLGAFGGELNSIISVGGDAAAMMPAADKKANRFVPVVMHAGPFYLKKGEKASHSFTMPNYVGSVRAMVVAASEAGAYGSHEATVPVKKPLMILATLPRVLGPTETLLLPINVFAMEDNVRDVSIKVTESNGLVDFPDGNTQSLSFSKQGDKMAYVGLRIKDKIGIAKFKIVATSGSLQATQSFEIDVRNPNPQVTTVMEANLNPGEQWNESFLPVGVEGTNEARLEVSNIPPIDFGKRMKYLLRYPHGCLEQTTSSAFPQLFVKQLMELNDEQKETVKKNIAGGIKRLQNFQISSGAFSYWPGNNSPNNWSTSYVGHFLLKAKEQGYQLPGNMLSQWIKYQKGAARNWNPKYEEDNYYRNSDLMQAYRLYTLALAGEPVMSAMNSLRKQKELSAAATWRLATAYALAGKEKIAKDLVNDLDTEVQGYRSLSYTFGSSLRDEAMILETLVLLEDENRAAKLVQRIAKSLSSRNWYSTQTTSYCLMAIAQYAGGTKVGDAFTYEYTYGTGSNTTTMGTNKPLSTVDLAVDMQPSHKVSIKNTSDAKLFVRLILTGQPLIGNESSAANELAIDVTYKDMSGKEISIDALPQGRDFIAEVKVTNPGTSIYRSLEEMALTQIFPSGWEIINSRLSNIQSVKSDAAEYTDIRDDRVYTYFDINNKAAKTYRVQLNAAYQGRYYLPAVDCSAMYNDDVYARTSGKWVEVIEPQIN